MPASDPGSGSASLIVFLIGLLIFATPLAEWWAGQHPPWYVPFLLWLGLIALIGTALWRTGRHDL